MSMEHEEKLPKHLNVLSDRTKAEPTEEQTTKVKHILIIFNRTFKEQ